MNAQPTEPNERTVALGQHRIEDAIAFWRNGQGLVERESLPRRRAYERAVNLVLSTLQDVATVPALLAAYYHISEDRWAALRAACDLDTGQYPPNAGIVEDAAFGRRFQEIVAVISCTSSARTPHKDTASQQAMMVPKGLGR